MTKQPGEFVDPLSLSTLDDDYRAEWYKLDEADAIVPADEGESVANPAAAEARRRKLEKVTETVVFPGDLL